MAIKSHIYHVNVEWTGNRGTGTSAYAAYGRDHLISADGNPDIVGSADPAFRGDAARWNPEELLIASLSACHKLWYLHLCADAKVVVTAYRDEAEGFVQLDAKGEGKFTSVVLRPHVTVARGADLARARSLHADVHDKCAIAQSVNFPVSCEPMIVEAD